MSEQDENINGDQNDDVDSDRADDADGADALGDAGKKALDAMKGKWQKERDERKARDARIAELEAQLAKPKGDGEAEPDADKIREQAKAEARAEVLRDRAMDRVEARAAKLFADPEDARALLAGQVEDFLDNGKVDADAIDDALADLLKKKPHLAAQSGGRFAGGADGGARNGSGRPQQITETQLKHMTPRQIVEAQAKGQLDNILGLS